MAKITAIKAQQKRQDRVSIYLDDQYAFSLSKDQLVERGLYKGQEISEAEQQELQADSDFGKLFNRTLDFAILRPRSQYEIEDYLQRKQLADDTKTRILEKLARLSLINDREFARKWVEWRQSLKPRSKRQLRAELAKKRLDTEIIDEALAEVDDETERLQVQELIAKKRKQVKYQDHQKLMAFLARQGYDYELIKDELSRET